MIRSRANAQNIRQTRDRYRGPQDPVQLKRPTSLSSRASSARSSSLKVVSAVFSVISSSKLAQLAKRMANCGRPRARRGQSAVTRAHCAAGSCPSFDSWPCDSCCSLWMIERKRLAGGTGGRFNPGEDHRTRPGFGRGAPVHKGCRGFRAGVPQGAARASRLTLIGALRRC